MCLTLAGLGLDAAPPATPTGLTATGGTGSISLSGYSATRATSYDGEYSADGGSTWNTLFSSQASIPQVDASATSHVQASTGQVYYRVRGRNAAGPGPWTDGTAHASPWIEYTLFPFANGTNLNGQALEVGGSWAVAVARGSYDVQSNTAHGNTSATANEATVDAGQTNLTVNATGHSTTSTTRLGLLLRFGVSDAASWAVYWDGFSGGGTLTIYENFSTIRASGALTYVAGKDWNFVVSVLGMTISATVTQADNPSNTLTLTYSSMASGLSNTKCGIEQYSNESGSGWKSFKVTTP